MKWAVVVIKSARKLPLVYFYPFFFCCCESSLVMLARKVIRIITHFKSLFFFPFHIQEDSFSSLILKTNQITTKFLNVPYLESLTIKARKPRRGRVVGQKTI